LLRRASSQLRVGLYALSFVPQAPQKDAASIPHANPAKSDIFSTDSSRTVFFYFFGLEKSQNFLYLFVMKYLYI
jgi:hypothetical protein